MENKKSIIITGAILIIVIASLFTVFKFSRDKVLGNPFVGDVAQQKEALATLPSVSYDAEYESGALGRNSLNVAQDESLSVGAEIMEVESQDRKISQNASLSGETGDVSWALERISEVAKGQGGYILSSNIYENNQKKRFAMATVQVPSDNFEAALDEIKSNFRINQESTYQDDVTREYQDLEARIKNKKTEEEAFSKILVQAKDTEDVIDVTRELSRVRSEIERLEIQKKYYDNMVDMSRININLAEEEEISVDSTWRPIQVIKGTVNSLIKDIQKSINLVIVLFIRIIPIAVGYLVIALIIYWIIKVIYRKVKTIKRRDKKL